MSFLNFLSSEHMIAFLVTVSVFLITIFLVVKRWIGFSIASLFLLFALAAGVITNYQQEIHHYLTGTPYLASPEVPSEDFHKQMAQAVENLKVEITSEKENLQHLMSQVQEIFDSMDKEKQKLHNFIEEVREHFKTDTPTTSPSPDSQ